MIEGTQASGRSTGTPGLPAVLPAEAVPDVPITPQQPLSSTSSATLGASTGAGDQPPVPHAADAKPPPAAASSTSSVPPDALVDPVSPAGGSPPWSTKKKVIWGGVVGTTLLATAVFVLHRKASRIVAAHLEAQQMAQAQAARRDEMGSGNPVPTGESETLGQNAGASTADPAPPPVDPNTAATAAAAAAAVATANAAKAMETSVKAETKSTDAMVDVVNQLKGELSGLRTEISGLKAKLEDPLGAKERAAKKEEELKKAKAHLQGHDLQPVPMPEEDWLKLLDDNMTGAGVDAEVAKRHWMRLPDDVRLNFLSAMGTLTADGKKELVTQIGGGELAAHASKWEDPLGPMNYKILLQAALTYGALYKHLPPQARHLGLPALEHLSGVTMTVDVRRHSALLRRMRERYLPQEILGEWGKKSDEQKFELQLEALGRASAKAYTAGLDSLRWEKFEARIKHLPLQWNNRKHPIGEASTTAAWANRLNPAWRKRVEREFLDQQARVYDKTRAYFGDAAAKSAGNIDKTRDVSGEIYGWKKPGGAHIGAWLTVGGLGALAAGWYYWNQRQPAGTGGYAPPPDDSL